MDAALQRRIEPGKAAYIVVKIAGDWRLEKDRWSPEAEGQLPHVDHLQSINRY